MDEATRKLIAEYLEKARSKLKAAEVLFQQELFDDTVSRAYYAAFHAAQAVLLSEGQKAETGAIPIFSRQGDPQEWGKAGKRLWR